jgi:hypothetical protein
MSLSIFSCSMLDFPYQYLNGSDDGTRKYYQRGDPCGQSLLQYSRIGGSGRTGVSVWRH